MSEPERTAKASASIDVDAKINEICDLLDDTKAEIRKKVASVMCIPKSIETHSLTSERCEKLFSHLQIEVLECVLLSEDNDFQEAKPIVAHILCFCCQMTDIEVYKKFKPLVPQIVKLIDPKKNVSSATLNDIALILNFMPFEQNDFGIIYDTLRSFASFFVHQKTELNVSEFLTIVRLMLAKIYAFVSNSEPVTDVFIDTRGWSVGILSILRNLVKIRPENVEESIRIGMWDVIGSMARLIGPIWFTLDEAFAKLVAQLNTVELHMCVQIPQEIVPSVLARHLRILEVYVSATHEEDVFRAGSLEDIAHAVGDGVKLIMQFWADAEANKEELAGDVSLTLFTFAIFLLSRGELELLAENVQKQIGPLMITEAITLLEGATYHEMRVDVNHYFREFFEKAADIVTLDERVALLAANYLVKLRSSIERNLWHKICAEVTISLIELRGRIDWYTSKTLDEALKILDTLEEDDKPDVSGIVKLIEKLPRLR